MSKDEIDAVAKATAEIVKAIPIYKDGVQPVTQEVGKALKTVGGVINLALAPFAAMVYGFDLIKENLKNRLENRLSNTLPGNIVEPSLQIVGPLLDKYRYVHDNEALSEMFINLLANAMDKDKVKKAHPSFVNVISELSPDEARLLKVLAKDESFPKLDITKKSLTGESSGYIYIYINFTLLGEQAKLDYPDLTPSYLSNLERLNIITCPVGGDESFTAEELYKPLEEHSLISELKGQLNKTEQLDIKRGIIRITDFGKLFIQAVL